MQITLSGSQATGYTTYMALTAGETVAEAITISSAGSPVVLTGYTLKMQILFPVPLSLTTTNGGITITNASQGIAQVNISDTASAALPIGAFPFDFWMVSGGGVTTRLLAGTFTVNQNLSPIP